MATGIQFSQFNIGQLPRSTDIVVGLRSGLDTQYTFGGVNDTNGNPILTWNAGAGTPVNGIDFVSGATSVAPIIQPFSDTDIAVNLELLGLGTGHVYAGGTGAFGVPVGTTGEQPAGFAGGLRYNTTTDFMEYWDVGVGAWVDIISGAAFDDATYVTNTDETVDLPNSQPLSALSTGIMQVTTGTGIVSSLPIPLTMINGGTSAALSAALGGLVYTTATAMAVLPGNITTAKQYLSQTGTGAVSADPAWATISGGDITGAALTAGNDTNVTLSLGGTPATALLRAASITAGWTGQLSLARGGTNANLTANNGGIFYSTATAAAILAGTATANQMLQSGATAAPTWSTATWPATTTVSQLLYSSSANVVAGLATANSAALVTNSTGVPAWSSSMTDGQIIIGSTGATPTAATLTQGSGVTITNGAGTITISATGSGGTVTDVTASAPLASSGGATPNISLTGIIALANGGTNKALVAANGGVVYSDADSLEILAPTATAAQMLQSGSSSAPAWSTTTWPATSTANRILYSSATNVIGEITSANSAALVTTSAGAPGFTSSMTNGQLVIGSTGATPVAASLTAGTNITITPGAGSITITASGAAGNVSAYANYNGTTATIAQQSNVASITNNATGDYTVTWTSAFATTDYAPVVAAADTAASKICLPFGSNVAGTWTYVGLTTGAFRTTTVSAILAFTNASLNTVIVVGT